MFPTYTYTFFGSKQNLIFPSITTSQVTSLPHLQLIWICQVNVDSILWNKLCIVNMTYIYDKEIHLVYVDWKRK